MEERRVFVDGLEYIPKKLDATMIAKVEAQEKPKQYPIVCSKCGNDATVPFEPKPGSFVTCRDCYVKRVTK